ncbi:MAG: 4'-phosphopantetheinyl transferase superfamily protein [Oscillospiraceae bacterium]|nr:4'-phosphopantetheinyl transferase superfamily protein [Oscillospiraceae bacterium]
MLWIIDWVEQAEPTALLAHLDELSPARQARIRAMKTTEGQLCSLLAELLLRCALKAEFTLNSLPRQAFGEKGKPFFPDFPEICFNLSHCRNAVVCGLDTAPLGVDAQELRPLGRKGREGTPLLLRVLSPSERAWVLAAQSEAEQERRFTALWTCKEAYGKATGNGILYDLDKTTFLPRSVPWEQYGFCFQQFELPGCFVTLCGRAPLALRSVSPEEILN